MSVFDQELILPGVITDIVSDYSVGYDTSKFGTTDSVTILGTAFDGPVGKPVKIYSPEHAKYIFGSSFDFKTKREATLIPEIYNAWDRGCRTIYAIRVSGKEIYKDFEFASDTKCRLRVSGIFPSNDNKDIFFEYSPESSVDGREALIKVYKPATRATIEEKMLGKVIKENSILVNSVKLKNNWNITNSNRLMEFIDLFNDYKYNNVLKLTIVDDNGNDISQSAEAQGLSFGDLLPGVYFVGRDANADAVTAKTLVESTFITDDLKNSTYEAFTGNILKTLKCNTDITKPFPIYHTSANELGTLIGEAITSLNIFSFLETPGKVDALWLKDKNDYEEVKLDDFDMYTKLGSGFASTAKIVEMNGRSGAYKVVEVTDSTDDNRVQPINDGIYSMLENLKSDYRVLTGKFADTEIKGALPKKNAFLVSNPLQSDILGKDSKKAVKIIPILDKKDLSAPKKYSFALESIAENSELYSKDQMIAKLYKEMGSNTIKIYSWPLETAVKDTFVADTKSKFILVQCSGNYVVCGKTETEVVPQAMLSEVMNETSALFSAMTVGTSDVTDITIRTANLDTLTLNEFISQLNENETLKELFVFRPSDNISKEDEMASVDTLITVTTKTEVSDRMEPVYDKTLYIPYRTNDNFARQLAQHCIYTGLKTAPTHGVIGCSKLIANGLSAVAARVEKLAAIDFNLYAKRPNGNDMLDRSNMPYPIGRAISVTAFQHSVDTGDNYTYVSSGAGAYAGMISVLPIDQSSTSQPINISNVSYDLTNFQLSILTQAGYVTVKNSYTKGYIITDGVTMAPVSSPFRRLSVSRIINGIDEAIRSAAEPFIGKTNNLTNRNSLQTAIKSNLDKMLDKLIEKYDFSLVVDKAAERMGIIEIEYAIVVLNEIREVRNRVSVKDQL